jgi:hypothetical protein
MALCILLVLWCDRFPIFCFGINDTHADRLSCRYQLPIDGVNEPQSNFGPQLGLESRSPALAENASAAWDE